MADDSNVGRFIKERYVLQPHDKSCWVDSIDVYNAYKAWSDEKGARQVKLAWMHAYMESIGYGYTKIDGQYRYYGVILKSEPKPSKPRIRRKLDIKDEGSEEAFTSWKQLMSIPDYQPPSDTEPFPSSPSSPDDMVARLRTELFNVTPTLTEYKSVITETSDNKPAIYNPQGLRPTREGSLYDVIMTEHLSNNTEGTVQVAYSTASAVLTISSLATFISTLMKPAVRSFDGGFVAYDIKRKLWLPISRTELIYICEEAVEMYTLGNGSKLSIGSCLREEARSKPIVDRLYMLLCDDEFKSKLNRCIHLVPTKAGMLVDLSRRSVRQRTIADIYDYELPVEFGKIVDTELILDLIKYIARR